MDTTKKSKRYEIDKTRKVFLYFNLHKKVWSVRQDGLVKAHANSITLKDVEFKVSEAGRKRVLREKRKNVHAGAWGYIDENAHSKPKEVPVSYNPYKGNTFYRLDNKEPIEGASRVLFEKGAFAEKTF